MLRFTQILVSALVLCYGLLSLGACGQQGPLYFPTDRAAATRATLPETLLRQNAAPDTDASKLTKPATASSASQSSQ